MGKTFILTEKPSQAKDFSSALGGMKYNKDNQSYENDGYVICSAAGHLIENYMPQDYDDKYKSWKKEYLPIIPKEFGYKVRKDTKKKYKTIADTLKRKDIDKVIVATDAEREGELIARLIFKQAKFNINKGNVYRFWTSSALTKEEVLKGLKSVKPIAEYDRYYYAALARQQADWLVGLNATMIATITANGAGVVTLGRVQSPTLSMLATRRDEIDNFVPKNYYQVIGCFEVDSVYYGKLVDEKFNTIDFQQDEKNKADEIILECKKSSKAIVKSIDKKKKSTKPPKLYSLSNIQTEASSKLKFAVSKTTKIMQDLYDKKYTTYPRTSSTVLSSDMVELAKSTLNKVFGITEYSKYKANVKVDGSNKQVFNDKELSDHHAIIPTGIIPKDLTKDEQAIYDLVCKRFIAAFMPDYEYESTSIVTAVDKYNFYTTGNTPISLGWKEIYKKDAFIDNDTLPVLKVNDTPAVKDIQLDKKQTTPPSEYTEGTLIASMKNPSSFVKDPELKKKLKDDLGLGTEATRSGIIDNLKKRGFIENKKNQLTITPQGMRLIKSMEGEQIIDPTFTAFLEQDLDKIVRGEIDNIDIFMNKITKYVKELVENISKKNIGGQVMEKEVFGKCPECGGDVTESKKAYNCENEECKFVFWKKLGFRNGEDIKPEEMKEILANYETGEQIKMKAHSKKTGKDYEANFILHKDEKYGWQLKMSFDND